MKLHTKQLTLAALTAAAYAVLSYFGSIFGITYGPIQCRFSEALCVLPFFLPETAWGLGVGCLIAGIAFQANWLMIGLAAVASGAVGAVFGAYPAYKASSMDPVEALRM